MPSIIVRPQAAADLAEIWAYIAEDSSGHADKFLSRVDRELRSLARHPKIGRERLELSKSILSFAIRRYVVFYVPQPRGIELVRVLHGSRDLEFLFEETDE